MLKSKLKAAVSDHKEETRDALQTMYDSLNSGQKKQIVKKEKVSKLFDRYGVKKE